jgi:hypothetical protein
VAEEIIFLDLAGRTGVCEGEVGGTPRLYSVQLSRESDDDFDAAGRAVLWMAERFILSRPRAVYAEAAPAFTSMRGKTNARTLKLLIGLGYAIGGVCKARRVPFHVISVSTVRAWCIGQGNMEGEKAKRESARVARALGWFPSNLDEADAAAGWAFACSLCDKTIRRPMEHWAKRPED